MINTSVATFSNNLFETLKNAILFNERINIVTDDGNAILLSEEDYNGIIATLELLSQPGMVQKITEGLNTPIEDCIPASEVEW